MYDTSRHPWCNKGRSFGVKTYWHLPKKVELCHIYAKDEGETIAKINLEIGEINQGMRTAKQSSCFCLFIIATTHPPRKDPIGHSPVPEGKEWEKGRQHKFAISACVYALLLGPTLNMSIFISDSDAISSCFFFTTCLQTSLQSVRCLQAYKPPLPGQFPSWNRHIFETCLFSPCPNPPLPNDKRQTLTAYKERWPEKDKLPVLGGKPDESAARREKCYTPVKVKQIIILCKLTCESQTNDNMYYATCKQTCKSQTNATNVTLHNIMQAQWKKLNKCKQWEGSRRRKVQLNIVVEMVNHSKYQGCRRRKNLPDFWPSISERKRKVEGEWTIWHSIYNMNGRYEQEERNLRAQQPRPWHPGKQCLVKIKIDSSGGECEMVYFIEICYTVLKWWRVWDDLSARKPINTPEIVKVMIKAGPASTWNKMILIARAL